MAAPHKNTRAPSPHEELLSRCVAAWVTGRRDFKIPDQVSWGEFVTSAVRHGIAPPAAAVVLDDPRMQPPGDVRSVLSRLIVGNHARNAEIFTQTDRLLAKLSAAGVDSLVLKGVALSLSTYPDPAHRNFADVDILVRREQMERANEVLENDGWAPDGGVQEPTHHAAMYERTLPDDILTATIAPEFDPSLTPERLAPHTHRLRLEVHRSPFYDVSGAASSADLAAFWERAQTVDFPSGASFLAPSPEAMLVHLCAHAAAHAFQKLQFVLDVGLLLRRSGDLMDPDVVARLAHLYGATQHVRRLVGLVHREMGVRQAAPILAAMPEIAVTPLAWSDIFRAHGADVRENKMRHWLAAGTAGERTRGALRSLFPEPAAMHRIYGVYHPAIVAALYIWRPVQLTGRLTVVLARMALRSSGRLRKEHLCPGSEPS